MHEVPGKTGNFGKSHLVSDKQKRHVFEKIELSAQQAYDVQQAGGIDRCLSAAQEALEKGLKLRVLHCPKCKNVHLDEGEHMVAHTMHTCQVCKATFRAPGRRSVVGNPLADWVYTRVEQQKQKDCEMNQSENPDFVTLQQPSMEGSTVSSRLQNEKQQGSYVQDGSCKEAGIDFTNLVQVKVCDIQETSLRTFKRDLKRGHFAEVFFCNSRLLENPEAEQKLHFTHQTAHGSWGAGDRTLGDHATSMLSTLKTKFSNVFSEPVFPAQRDVSSQHHIKLRDESADPPRKKLYPLDQVELAALKEQLDNLLGSGRIVHSASPFGAPILFAKKKDGGLRMCIDYRALNQNTILDRYPLPRIDDLLQRLKGAKVFSKLDLRDGYHQIPMAPKDMYKTAFCTRYGQFEFTVMPFGLCNAPATFQRVMNKMLFTLLDKCVLVYLDDILIYSKDVAQHKKDLESVFACLSEHNFKLKESKCALFLESVEFLGHTISARGVEVEQGKVDAVRDWPVPTCLNEVQQFLGLCNYYRRFVKGFSTIALPLTNLTRKKVQFVWDNKCQVAFEQLKECLTSAPCLKIFDIASPTRVVTDASGQCVGAVLEQWDKVDGQWHPVEYFSKQMSAAETRYSAIEREFLAIVLALERWRQFLVGTAFDVLTDHASLKYLQTQAKLSRQQTRWLDTIQQYQCTIKHVPGRTNVVADALSCIPTSSTADLQTVVSLGEESLLLEHVRSAQSAHADDPWFACVKAKAEQPNQAKFAIRNGVVCKLISDYYAPVIPPNSTDLKKAILMEIHASGLGGHVSFKKMHQRLKNRFFWTNLCRDCERFCKEYVVCQQGWNLTQAPSGLLQPHVVPAKPFEHVSVDFVTGLPCSDNRFDSVIVVVDRFSKWVIIIPCTEKITAVEFARVFFEHVVCHFGMPLKIISDRDVRFTSLFWQALVRLCDCKLNMSSAYHPQTDGQTERFNRSVEQVLRSYCSPRQNDWDQYLQHVAFVLNSTVHSGTRVSPFECLFGFTPRLPIDTALASLHDNRVQSVTEFVHKRQQVQQHVTRNLKQYAEQMKRQADKHRRMVPLSVGDYVWVSTANLRLPGQLSRKLAPKWVGPFPIIQQVSQVSYKLQLTPEFKSMHPVFHASVLKPHHGPPPSPRTAVFQPATEELEFEVEAVVGKRIVRNKPQYLVQWRGYGPWDATWEPLENLKNAMSAVKQFEALGKRQ